MRGHRSLIARYYAYRATNSAGFYLPVAILYLTDSGYSLGFVGLAYGLFSVGMVAAEIPTGYLGDLLGRRASLALGSALRAVTLGAYPFVDGAFALLVLHLVWAVAWAFRSGTQGAWLYELLCERFDEDEYARIDGRGKTVLSVTSAVGAIAGGLLYGVDPALPFVANAGLAALGIPLLVALPAVEGSTADERFGVRDAVRTLRLQSARPAVRWLVLYAALFSGLFSITRVFEQPSLRAVGVPVAGLGVVYAAFKLVEGASAASAGWIKDTLGTRRTFALLVPLFLVAYAALAVVPTLILPLLFLSRARGTITRPLRNQYVNDRLGDVGRATVLSGVSMVVSVAAGTAKLVGGWAATYTGPLTLLPWAGVGISLVAGLLWVATDPVRGRCPGAPACAGGSTAAD